MPEFMHSEIFRMYVIIIVMLATSVPCVLMCSATAQATVSASWESPWSSTLAVTLPLVEPALGPHEAVVLDFLELAYDGVLSFVRVKVLWIPTCA